MSDLPPIKNRHWLEYAATVLVLSISVISLWVAIGTEDANRQMVAAASWPFLQLDSSNSDDQEQPHIQLSIANSGVGPAKVESFELFWNGKAYARSDLYLKDCCGATPYGFPLRADEPKHTPILTASIAGAVIRAGESRLFLTVRLGPDNAVFWHALDRARFKTQFRACYCSVFDECWISNLRGLQPERVDKCPVPKVVYEE